MTAPVNRAHKKTGRPLKLAPAGAGARIEALAADGFSMIGVARGMGISEETLAKWFDTDPTLKEAFNRGRETERHTLHNMLYRQATEAGNATAAMFLLKARHGYREGDTGDQANRVSINFSLPGAMSLKDFGVIENAADNSDQRLPTKSITLTRGS